MTSPEVAESLDSAAKASQDARPNLYNNLLQQVISSDSAAEQKASDLKELSEAVLSGSLSIVSTRPLLANLIQSLSKVPPESIITVGSHVLNKLQSQSTTFEQQEALLRETLCTAYEAEEDYSTAAKTLQGIRLDTSQRQISDEAKVRTWIKIVRLFLEDDDTVAAEQALNKIKNLPSSNQTLTDSADLKLHYQLSQAKILDARRRFLDASAEYYNVSTSAAVAEDDRLQALSAAIKTAVLAPAGPQRSKTLGKLYRDDRSADTDVHAILEKMFLDRLLSADEVDAFAAGLMPHQLARTGDGSTVMAKAVVEHNLLAASKLYEKIPTTTLARILGLEDDDEIEDDHDDKNDTTTTTTAAAAAVIKTTSTAAEKAQDYAARMMEQGRLRGKIDQIDGVIAFEVQDGVAPDSSHRELRQWDHAVQGLVEDVERCAAAVAEAFPRIVA